ncbi:MAG: NADH-quinone oxidoreductase subunit H, partial [Chloroflexota bacterium]|nr:NADH-quinone oxidoreductase subunit H [Chloroflexota bacterium]
MGTPLLENYLFRNVYCPLAANQGNKAVCGWNGNGLLPAGWEWLAYFLAGFAIIFILVNALLLLGMVYTWTERRVLGRFQSRLGPNRWGPWGLLTPVADAIKLLLKEDIVPRAADRLLFNLAPVLMVVPVFLTLAVVPFAHNTFLADL